MFKQQQSLLFISLFIFNICIAARNDFGCNGYDSTSGTFYPTDICIPDTRSNVDNSLMYMCDDTTSTLWKFSYDSRDCSGNISSSYEYNTTDWIDYVTCKSEYQDATCDYMMMVTYDQDSDCNSETGDEYDLRLLYIVDQCVNGSVFGDSQYVTCSQDSFNIKFYESYDCSGDVYYQYTKSPYDYSSEASSLNDDAKMYCSKAGAWSECNENSAFNMNNKYILRFTAALFVLIFIQLNVIN